MFLFATLGLGTDGFYQMALDTAVLDAARQIQIDGPAASGGTAFVAAVCNELPIDAATCTSTLSYNVQISTPQSGFSAISPAALPASGQFGQVFYSPGSTPDYTNILVQVAMPVPFQLPYIASLITGTGTNSIVSTASVRMEPF